MLTIISTSLTITYPSFSGYDPSAGELGASPRAAGRLDGAGGDPTWIGKPDPGLSPGKLTVAF